MTHNRLTVDTMAPTQMEPSHERRGYAAQEGEEYFDRLDSKRYLIINLLCKFHVHTVYTFNVCAPENTMWDLLYAWNAQMTNESISLTQESLPYTF